MKGECTNALYRAGPGLDCRFRHAGHDHWPLNASGSRWFPEAAEAKGTCILRDDDDLIYLNARPGSTRFSYDDQAVMNDGESTMFQTIIVAVDVHNQEKASDMLDTAERLGGKTAKVILLNVIEPVANYIAVRLPKDHAEQVKTNATEELGRIAKSTSLETEVKLLSGHAAREILSAADDTQADAIIVASHRPGLEDYFLGSTATRVVRHATCSVVVIR